MYIRRIISQGARHAFSGDTHLTYHISEGDRPGQNRACAEERETRITLQVDFETQNSSVRERNKSKY